VPWGASPYNNLTARHALRDLLLCATTQQRLEVRKLFMTDSWTRSPNITTKIKMTMRGMDIIQTVYAFLMGLGLREAFLASYEIYLKLSSLGWDTIILVGLLFLNIVLLSVRFFWVPRNLRHLYFLAEASEVRSKSPTVLSAAETSVHIIIILVHSLLYFFLCRQFAYFAFVSIAYDSNSQVALLSYVFLHISLLIFNAFWLMCVNKREAYIRERSNDSPSDQKFESESRLWYRNNLFFSLLAVAPLAVFSSCGSELLLCIPHSSAAIPNATIPQTLPVIPTSALNIALFFNYFFDIAVKNPFIPVSREFIVGFWAMVALMLNSMFDLFLTAHYYVKLEEIEREVTYTKPAT
jgi:hypothetical protein